MSDPTREEIDAKLGASEARSDTKIARLEGKLDLVLSKLDDLNQKITTTEGHIRDDSRTMRSSLWGIGLGLAALMVTIVALFPVFFSIGTQVKDMVEQAVSTRLAK